MLPRYPRQNTKSVKPLCAYNFIICQRIGRPPISTMGLGRYSVSSRKRVPRPPHSITTFTRFSWQALMLVSLDFIHYSGARQGKDLEVHHLTSRSSRTASPVNQQAIKTAALMLGTEKSRGYCLEMICFAPKAAPARLDPWSESLC